MQADAHAAPDDGRRGLAVGFREPRRDADRDAHANSRSHTNADTNAGPERVADRQRLADADQPGARQLPDGHPDPAIGRGQPVGIGPSVRLGEPDGYRVSDADRLEHDLNGHDLRDRVAERDPRADADTLRFILPDALPDSPRDLSLASRRARPRAQTP